MHISKTLCTFATSKGTKKKLKQLGGKNNMATKQGKELLQAIRNTKKCAMRDAYDYMLYLADDGTYAITRLCFATYDYSTKSARYFSMTNRSKEAKAFCERLINKNHIKH